jgi:benzene/toluene dioxygenase alpha subunit/biphenyl 2,3-dioxygenase alpha subunit
MEQVVSLAGLRRGRNALEMSSLFNETTGVIDPSIYTDQEIYDLEMERIFGRSWLFLCHESQIRNAGDYVTSYMAEDPVVVVRQRDGSVKSFLNQCRHRGMRICRTDAGNARSFTCAYHGWGYDSTGALIAVPSEKDAYGEMQKQSWGARPVPRVESYKGLVFGNWDVEASSLDEYLGDVKFYLDAIVDRSPAGMEAYGGVFKWVVPSNWKFAAEQVCSDMYHGMTTHISVTVAAVTGGLLQAPPGASAPQGKQFRSSAGGHGSGFMTAPGVRESFHAALAGEVVKGWDPRLETQRAAAHISPQQSALGLQHLLVSPNFGVFDGACALRVFHPRGPNEMEFWSIGLVPVDASPEEKEQMRLANLRGLGPAGTLEQDDGENWVEVQRVLRGYQARNTPFNAQMGLGRARSDDPDFPGNVDYVLSEEAARGFYSNWLRMLMDDGKTSAGNKEGI